QRSAQPPPTSPTSTNLQSEQPSQPQRDPDRVGLAPQQELVDRAVNAQDLAYGAQVRLGDAAPVDQQQLVPGPDAHVRARAARHDVVHQDAAQPRPPRHEPQPAHVVVAQRAAGDARLDDHAAPGIIDDQTGPLEHGVADDTVDVRASEKPLALASQSGGGGRDPQAAEVELLQPHDRAMELAHEARADRRLD